MIDTARAQVGAFHTAGPLGWTFPAGLIALLVTGLCVVTFIAYGLFGSFPLCPDERGLTVSLVAPAAVGGACIGLTAVDSPLARTAVALLGALITGGLTWLAVEGIFALRC